MTAIEATAEAKVFKGKWYKRPRYTMFLYVNGVNTGLHWHLKRREVAKHQTALVDNAAEILHHYGLMESVYNRVVDEPTPERVPELVGAGAPVPAPGIVGGGFDKDSMPNPGQKVALAVGIGHFPKGLVGTVSRVDPWIDGYDESSQYPVRVALTHGADTVEIPLHLHEIEVAR